MNTQVLLSILHPSLYCLSSSICNTHSGRWRFRPRRHVHGQRLHVVAIAVREAVDHEPDGPRAAAGDGGRARARADGDGRGIRGGGGIVCLGRWDEAALGVGGLLHRAGGGVPQGQGSASAASALDATQRILASSSPR